MRRIVMSIVAATVAWIMAASPAAAAWPEFGRAIATGAGSQDGSRSAPDGAGGAIVVWVDGSASPVDLFAQHVLASGELDPAWPAGGRALLTDPASLPGPSQTNPAIVPDGAGGAIVAWTDGRSLANGTDIFAQHVLASGVVDPRWPANGAALCTAAGPQSHHAIVSDGAGGAIVVWMDARNAATGIDIFAQHVLASGDADPNWKFNGAAVCTAPGRQANPRIDTDGAGGAIVTWFDPRSSVTGFDIYAQHLLSEGIADLEWPADGVALCTAPGSQILPTIVSDGAHGAIVAWMDERSGVVDIFAHHVLASGALHRDWPVNGLAVCVDPDEQELQVMIPDGSGGAIVSWQDHRGGGHNMFAQHVLGSGTVDGHWPVNGIALSRRPTEQTGAVIVPDGAGGAIVTWEDNSLDIFTQHVLGSGTLDPAFPSNGQRLVGLSTVEIRPSMVPAGVGGAIVTWSDFRSDTSDIYALQLLTVVGVTGVDDPGLRRVVSFAAPRPNPARESLTLRFALPRAGDVSLAIFDIGGRRVRRLASGTKGPGEHEVRWNLRDEDGRPVGTGLFFARLDADGRVLTRKLATLR